MFLCIMENINRIQGGENMLTLNNYVKQLTAEEKANNTIIRYKSDIKQFQEIVGEGRITDEKLALYKATIIDMYEPSTVNTKIMTINNFLQRCGIDKSLKLLNIKHSFFLDDEKLLTTDDINKLQDYCRKHNNYRMYYLIETYIKTGIRVSEHEFITVRAVEKGIAVVVNKGSIRKVIIPKKLRKKLMNYIKVNGIVDGPVFITRNENPVDRRNIWSELQKIGEAVGVDKGKLHPHNFRHYFARVNYTQKKDIVKLAAMLGHSSIETTRNYLKVLVSEVQKEMDEMEERMDRLSYNARMKTQNKGKGKNYQAQTKDYRNNQVLE